jgi:predicted transcriptional regulator of viral defense system
MKRNSHGRHCAEAASFAKAEIRATKSELQRRENESSPARRIHVIVDNFSIHLRNKCGKAWKVKLVTDSASTHFRPTAPITTKLSVCGKIYTQTQIATMNSR